MMKLLSTPGTCNEKPFCSEPEHLPLEMWGSGESLIWRNILYLVKKTWWGGGRSAVGVLHCFSSSVRGGLCAFGVLVCSATISHDCYSERNVISSWMQNKCGKLLRNQIASFSAFSCAMLYLLFESLNEIAVAGWILFCDQLHEVWSVWCCFQTGV